VTFARLARADWVALIAAFALLLVMSVDWYSTEIAVDARKSASSLHPTGAEAKEAVKELKDDAEVIGNRNEKNAWQAGGFADRLVLFALLATAACAIASAFLRASDTRLAFDPRALTTLVGLGTVLLLTARIVQKPGAEVGAVVKWGAPLGLVAVGVVTIAARIAWKGEREDEPDTQAAEPDDRHTSEREAIRRPAPLFDHEVPADVAMAPSGVAVQAPPMPQARPDAEPEPEPAASKQVTPVPQAPAPARAPAPPPAPRPPAPEPQPAADLGDTDWAPDWSDPAVPAEPAPAPGNDSKPRRRGLKQRLGRRRYL
jgi:hypothetical protein